MNTIKTTILITTGIIAISIMVVLIQLLLNPLKLKGNDGTRTKPSFSIWFASLFISVSIVISKAIVLANEAIDNIFKMDRQIWYKEIVKTISLFIGLSLIWFLIWYFISSLLTRVLIGKRNYVNEMDVDNYTYFLMKGSVLVGTLLSLNSILESIIRMFIPSVSTIIYH